MSDQELKYKITTEGNTKGGEDVARVVDKIDKSAKSAAPAVAAVGKSSKDMAQGLGEGAAVGNAAVSAISNLQTVSEGGAPALMAVARAAFATGVSIKGLLASLGPFGIAAAAIAIALGLISTALRSSEAAAADTKKKIDELNKAKLDDLVRELGGIKRAADEGKAALEAEAQLVDRIADAKLARDKAAVDANNQLTPETREREKLRLSRQREDERIEQGIDTDRRRSSIDYSAQDLAERQYQRAGGEAAKLTEIIARYEGAKAEEARLREEEYFIYKGDLAKVDAQADAVASARQRRKDIEPAAKMALAELPGAIGRADAALKAYGDAVKAAQTSSSQYLQSARTEAGVGPLRKDTRALTDKADASNTPEGKAKIAADLAKEVERLKRQPRSVTDEQVANGSYTNQGAYVEVFGRKDWERYSRSARESAAKAAAQTGAATAAKPSGGIMTTADGRVIDTNAARPTGPSMIGRDGLPVPVQSGQPTGPGRGAYREDGGLSAAADKVATAADKNATDTSAAQEQLAKLGEGTAKIAENTGQLTTQLSSAATELGTANDGLASAIASAATNLGATIAQSVTLGGQNVAALVELSGRVRELASQVSTFQSQLAAARSRK